MKIRRIVSNIAADRVADAEAFYGDFLGLGKAMDLGWIVTFAATGESAAPLYINVASEGGSGTPVPRLSIEVDDVDAAYAKAEAAGFEIAYPLTDEPWGVRRFYLRDPFGTLINIAAHR